MGCIIGYIRAYMRLFLVLTVCILLAINFFALLAFLGGNLHISELLSTCANWIILPIYYAVFRGILWFLEQLHKSDKASYRREIMADLPASED